MSFNIAIGGTKGKSTILFLLEHCMLDIFKKSNVLSISSTDGAYYNKSPVRNTDMDNFINPYHYFTNISYDYCLSEAVSAQLKRGTYDNIKINISVYTGIEKSEHLEVHKTFNNYLKSKKKLYDLQTSRDLAVINSDDEYANYIIKSSKAKIVTYGLNSNSDYKIKILKLNYEIMLFSIKSKDSYIEIKSNLLGVFNAMNITACFIILKELKIESLLISNSISKFKGIPGRFQRVELKNNTVIIDYAHTPNSLNSTLKLLRTISKKKLITVFGCGGNKSHEKRKLMGDISSKLSDYVIITNDNPRFENPKKIANDIKLGIEKNNYKIILDRKMAIRYSLTNFHNANILIAGKGNEKFMQLLKHYEILVCKNCGTRTRRMFDTPQKKFIKYSDLDYVYKYSKKGKLINDIKFGDYIFTYEEILNLKLGLHCFCHINGSVIRLETKKNLEITVNHKVSILLSKLDFNKSLSEVFYDMKIKDKKEKRIYINLIEKLYRISVIVLQKF